MSIHQAQIKPPDETKQRPQPTPMRKDIQALRALAVGLVVIYHLWPKRLTGGFIGVDVFFVISGFLITSHLIAKPPKKLKDFGEFWGRRIRRLLPIAFLVMGATMIAIYFIAPVSQWAASAKQLIASVFYVQNWALANEAVDYLAADNVPTALQHYWSLSVEEQFYIFWPLFLGLLFFFGARQRIVKPQVFNGLGVAALIGVSLWWSHHLTQTVPGEAYFVTTTRMWELAFGGLAAILFPWITRKLAGRSLARTLIAWAGIFLILYAAITFDGATVFPGTAAILPVFGAVLLLVANADNRFGSPTQLGSPRFIQHLGDISYGVYLWHWPFIVLVPSVLGHTLKWPEKLAILLVITILASLSKTLVEDPFRGRKAFGPRLSSSYIFAAAGMVIIASGALLLLNQAHKAEEAAAIAVAEAELKAGLCLGGNALVNEGCEPHGEKLIMEPAFAAVDKPEPYKDNCWVMPDFSDQKSCKYGVPSDQATARIALVGNSHAGHWLPPLQEIAEKKNWSIETYLASECYTILSPLEFENDVNSRNCLSWNEHVVEDVRQQGFDAVVFSNRSWRSLIGMTREETHAVVGEDYLKVLDIWNEAGIPVLVLRDTPYANVANVPQCVDENRENLSNCDGSLARKVPDPLADASQDNPTDLLKTLDLTNRICNEETCFSVVGGLIVYFDSGHLSASFAKTLQDPISAALGELMGAEPN